MSTAVDTGTTRPTGTTLPAGTWTVDPVHSQVAFAVGYHVGTFRGSFAPIDAKLEVGDDGKAKLTGTVAVSGVRVQDENLAGHLQAPDFFDAERAPEISFVSSAIRRHGDELEIEGELTIRGTGVPVTARGRIGEQKQYMERPYLGLELEATVDRGRFGLNWNNPLPNGEQALANDVTITAELYLTRA
jgi:polyisoprenoid-binding protein YceI